MINNGIISFGDNNINIIDNDLDYTAILVEIDRLKETSREDLNGLSSACQSKNRSKLIEELKKLKNETFVLIKHLGLKILESLIEKNII